MGVLPGVGGGRWGCRCKYGKFEGVDQREGFKNLLYLQMSI